MLCVPWDVGIVTDGGTEFVNEVLNLIVKALEINKTIICAFHPSSSGVCEGANATVSSMLHTLVQGDIPSWDKYLLLATMAYNCGYHCTIKDIAVLHDVWKKSCPPCSADDL